MTLDHVRKYNSAHIIPIPDIKYEGCYIFECYLYDGDIIKEANPGDPIECLHDISSHRPPIRVLGLLSNNSKRLDRVKNGAKHNKRILKLTRIKTVYGGHYQQKGYGKYAKKLREIIKDTTSYTNI